MSIALQIAILAIQLGVVLFFARIAGNLLRKLRMPAAVSAVYLTDRRIAAAGKEYRSYSQCPDTGGVEKYFYQW